MSRFIVSDKTILGKMDWVRYSQYYNRLSAHMRDSENMQELLKLRCSLDYLELTVCKNSLRVQDDMDRLFNYYFERMDYFNKIRCDYYENTTHKLERQE